MRHSALRRMIGFVAILAFLAVPLNASLALPVLVKAATAAVVSDGDDGVASATEGCGGHRTMTRHDCMAMCAAGLFAVPCAEAIADVPLRSERPGLPMLMRAGLELSPEPHPPKLPR